MCLHMPPEVYFPAGIVTLNHVGAAADSINLKKPGGKPLRDAGDMVKNQKEEKGQRSF